MNLSLVTPPPSSLPSGKEEEKARPIQQSRKRKAPKAVRFLPVVEIYAAPSPLDAVMREDETNAWKNDLWFSPEDLAEFRNTARDLCRLMRSAATASATPDRDESSMITTCSDPQTRGLEQRCCLERQRRKCIAIRFILKASSKLRARPKNPSKQLLEERLAAVAQKCNRWATLLAVQEAKRDFVRAYLAANDDEESRDDRETTAATSSVPPLKRRHSLATGQCSGTRRVRSRTSSRYA